MNKKEEDISLQSIVLGFILLSFFCTIFFFFGKDVGESNVKIKINKEYKIKWNDNYNKKNEFKRNNIKQQKNKKRNQG